MKKSKIFYLAIGIVIIMTYYLKIDLISPFIHHQGDGLLSNNESNTLNTFNCKSILGTILIKNHLLDKKNDHDLLKKLLNRAKVVSDIKEVQVFYISYKTTKITSANKEEIDYIIQIGLVNEMIKELQQFIKKMTIEEKYDILLCYNEDNHFQIIVKQGQLFYELPQTITQKIKLDFH